MIKESNRFANTAMLIRKPVVNVFEAFINPDITTKFWFTKSSGKLEEGKRVEWAWEMYGVSTVVKVKLIIPNERIIIEWGDPEDESIVEWSFRSLGESETYVSIMNKEIKGTTEDLIMKIRDSTGGFTWVLAGLKAYLEHNIELNLIEDRFPEKLRK